MTLRSSDLQSDSDLDSIRNSCDVLNFKIGLLVWLRGKIYFTKYTLCIGEGKIIVDRWRDGRVEGSRRSPRGSKKVTWKG